MDKEDFEDLKVASPEPRSLEFSLKRRRASVILRKMLEENGYGDLAKMVRIKEEPAHADYLGR